jgi:hypothetical protein
MGKVTTREWVSCSFSSWGNSPMDALFIVHKANDNDGGIVL